MHRALCIAEIRCLICAFATDDTLVVLARCCKAFHRPAIRVLWNAIPNLSPLVRCFPQDAWSFAQSARGRIIKLVRPLASEDWTAFLEYSHLVRRLGMSSSDIRLPLLQERVVWELSAYRPIFILFPNLVAFEWTSGTQWSEQELPVILGFLSPNTREVCIPGWRHDPGPLRSSLSLLTNRFTCLKDFRLVIPPSLPQANLLITPSVLSLVQGSPVLEVFEFIRIPLAQDVLNALATHRNLTTLAIRLPTQGLDWSTIDTQNHHFPVLGKVVVLARPQDYIDFSGKASFPRVKEAHIRLTDVLAQQSDLPCLLVSICSQFSPSVLKSLTVIMEPLPQDRRQLVQGTTVGIGDLQLFFKFEKLSVFKFSLASRYVLDSAGYLALAKTWPHLNTFELGLGELCILNSSDLRGVREVLVPFAVHCPKLKRLGVRFNADSIDAGLDTSVAITSALPSGGPSTSIVNFDCDDSPLLRSSNVAAFLALLVPRLRSISWKRTPSHAPQPGSSWGEVQHYLSLFAIVREDGRREAAKES